MASNSLDPLPDDIGRPGGLLNDLEINMAISKGYLLHLSTADLTQVKQSSYELRAGNSYQILTYNDSKIVHEERHVSDGDPIKIAPGCTFKIMIKEHLWIPPNVLAHVYVLGQYFACGLAAEHTYADPGFCHNQFYITMSNVSSRTLSIRAGTPIAKLQFHRLGSPVSQLYSGSPRPIENFVQYEKPKSIQEIKKIEKNEVLRQIASYGSPHRESAYVLGMLIRSNARIKLSLYIFGGLTSLGLFVYLGLILLSVLPESVRSLVANKDILAFFLGGVSTSLIGLSLKREILNTWHQAFGTSYYDREVDI